MRPQTTGRTENADRDLEPSLRELKHELNAPFTDPWGADNMFDVELVDALRMDTPFMGEK